MTAVKHTIGAEGADRVHSSAMKREHMDKILMWTRSTCPEIGSALNFLSIVLTKGRVLPSACGINDSAKRQITKHLQFLAFTSTAWTIWSRYNIDSDVY